MVRILEGEVELEWQLAMKMNAVLCTAENASCLDSRATHVTHQAPHQAQAQAPTLRRKSPNRGTRYQTRSAMKMHLMTPASHAKRSLLSGGCGISRNQRQKKRKNFVQSICLADRGVMLTSKPVDVRTPEVGNDQEDGEARKLLVGKDRQRQFTSCHLVKCKSKET